MAACPDETLTFEQVRAALSMFSGRGGAAVADGCGAAAVAGHGSGDDGDVATGCRCDGRVNGDRDVAADVDNGAAADTAAARDTGSAARRRAAVMVVVCGTKRPNVIMTVKPAHLRIHAGEVSFPGGKVEDGDRDLLHTALRETHEEIGLRLERDHVVARLCDVMTRNSRFIISPFVAVLDGTDVGCGSGGDGGGNADCPTGLDSLADPVTATDVADGLGGAYSAHLVLAPNSEVAEILVLPLAILLGTMSPDVDPEHSPVRGMHTFEYGDPDGRTIWGASARMLAQMRDLIDARRRSGGPA